MSLIMAPIIEHNNQQPHSIDVSLSSEDQEDANWIDFSDELAIKCFSEFKEFRKNGQLTDVIIKVDGKEIHAHRIILAATIPYFSAMFTCKMKEANSNVITISNIDADTMESIINFAYSGKIKFNFKNIERLLIAADYLQLTNLSNKCADVWKPRLNDKNVFLIRRFAIIYHIPQALIDADYYIQLNFCFIFKTAEFGQLDFATIMEILNWDNLLIDTEERIFEAICFWLDYDLTNRFVYAPKLLTAVRLPIIFPTYILDKICNNPLFWNTTQCRELIDEAKNYLLVPERRFNFNTIFKTKTRMFTELPGIIYALGGINQLHPINQILPSPVEFYDKTSSSWMICKQPMISQRTRFTVAASNEKIYVVGGFNGVERLKDVEMYNTNSHKWVKLNSMIERRSALCAISLGEYIFVVGGYNGSKALRSVESYEIRKERWILRQPMLSKRCAAGIAVLNSLIYVIGGHDGIEIFSSVECYDPVAEKWWYIAPLLEPRCRLSATTYQNKIYVVGGYNDGIFLNSAEVYDPETNIWSKIASMNLPRARVSLVSNWNLLYAIGGFDGENTLNTMEIYDPEKNRWDYGPSMNTLEGGVAAVVVQIMPKRKSISRNNNNNANVNRIKRPYNFDDSGEDDGVSNIIFGGPSTSRRMSIE